jgi:DNA-binding LytR/AlgR family response regulator
MTRVIIIEDEAVISRNLQKMVLHADPDMQVEAILPTVAASLEWLSTHPLPDLIFSDIQLADGNSFEIFEKNPVDCPIIFITAYDEYAMRAFRLNSLHYLLKPVNREEIQEAIDKFHRWKGYPGNYREQMSQLLHDLQHPSQRKFKTRFMAHYLKSIVPVPEDRVSCFHKDQLIYLHTRDGQELVTDYDSLEELEELLDPEKFFRANRQYIIHLDAITQFRTGINGRIIVHLTGAGQPEIEISREKAPHFREWMG